MILSSVEELVIYQSIFADVTLDEKWVYEVE